MPSFAELLHDLVVERRDDVHALLEVSLLGGTCRTPVPNATRSARPRQRRLERREDLGGGPLTGLDRSIHVAVPDGRGLRPGPVERSDRGAQGLPEPGPAAGRHVAAVAAAGPLLVGPYALDEALGTAGPIAEEPREPTQDGLPPPRRREAPVLPRAPPLQEPDQHTGRPARRRVVEGQLGRTD